MLHIEFRNKIRLAIRLLLQSIYIPIRWNSDRTWQASHVFWCDTARKSQKHENGGGLNSADLLGSVPIELGISAVKIASESGKQFDPAAVETYL